MEDCSINAKSLSVADVSFENDFLMDSSFSCSSFAHPSPGHPDHLDESPKSAEQEGSKSVQKYNPRKSLAWDSEFLNSPGVLEPDELISMIENAEKAEKSAIQKERQKSTDLKSPVSESLIIASLQNVLFEDTRASVQRTARASRVEKSRGKSRSVVSDSHFNQSPKKKELASSARLKPKPSSMKLSVGTPKSGKADNPLTIHPRVLQLRNNYSGGQSSSSPSKPPRAEMHSPVLTSTKRDFKAERKNAEGAAGRRVSSSRIHLSSVSHSMISPGPSSSRSVSSSTGATKAMHSSVAGFVCASSSSTIKSAAIITEPNRSTYASILTEPPPRTSPASSIGDCSSKSTSSIPTMQRSKSTKASTSISSPNTPPRPLATSKQTNDGKMLYGQKTRLAALSTTSGRSASLQRGINSVKPAGASQFLPQMHRSSSAKLSSTMSPASSNTDWSVRSSFSSSTTKPRSTSATPRMGNSYQKAAAPGPLKSPKSSNDQHLVEQKAKISARPAQHGRSASTGRLVVKPSSLRMPSPKIGFFDEDKSVRTPKGTKQSPNLVPGGLPNADAKTVGANESTNKLKVGSVQSPKRAMTIGSKKPEKNKQLRSHEEPLSSVDRASSVPTTQDSKPSQCTSSGVDGSLVALRDKESPSEVQTVKEHCIVKTVDSSPHLSGISSSEAAVLSPSTLSAKVDHTTGGGRKPFAAIHCNKDDSSSTSTVLIQAEKRIMIMSSLEDHVESSR